MHHTFLILICPLFTNGLSSALMAHAAQMKAFSMWICGTRGMGGFVPAWGGGPSSLAPSPPSPLCSSKIQGGGMTLISKTQLIPTSHQLMNMESAWLFGQQANRPTGHRVRMLSHKLGAGRGCHSDPSQVECQMHLHCG